jgi:hypothetical protein
MQIFKILARKSECADASFVANRKSEVLCFLGVAKFEGGESGSFVAIRIWRFWRRAALEGAAGIAGGR